MRLKQLWNSTSQADWLQAEKDYWAKITSNQLEQEIENLDPNRIRAMDVEQFYDWLWNKYFVWKYTAPNRLATSRGLHFAKYRRNDDLDELALIQKKLFCFDLADIATGLKVAMRIHGLGTAGASGLLAVLFPTHYGTVDQFVVVGLRTLPEYDDSKELQRIRKPDVLTAKDGIYLIQQMRNKAQALNVQFETTYWTPRKVDKILWTLRAD